MVFLRLGFVVGQAGVWCALLIVLASFALCLLTTLSLCSLIGDASDSHAASDGASSVARPQPTLDPGVYCALRRGVGPELGAALGLAFYMAFTVDAAFYTTGFAAMLNNTLPELHSQIQVFPWNPPGTYVDIIVASVALLLVAACCSRGVVVSARASLATLIGIVVCILGALLCVLLPPGADASGTGHHTVPEHSGFNSATLARNAAPNLSAFSGSSDSSIMLMFVLIFPGFTGVLAGSNLSGHLRTPTRSIARGSLSSLVFVLITYAAIILSLAGSVERPTLKKSLFVMNDVSVSSTRVPLGSIGVCLTTLTSALSYLLGAPRVLQAIARDSGWPPLEFFAKGSGPSGEPLRALALTWAFAQLILLTGTINWLAPLVTGLFLFTFCLINLLAFLAGLKRAPTDIAPTFQWNSRWLALLGFMLSALTMAVALASEPALSVVLCLLLLLLLVWKRRALLALVSSPAVALLDEEGGAGGLTSGGLPPLLEGIEGDEAAATLDERIERAAAYVHDALAGRFRGVHWALGSQSRIRAQRLLRGLRSARLLNILVYLANPFFEMPSWCYARRKCGNPEEVMRGGMPEAPIGVTQAIELVCIGFFAAEMGLKSYCMSPRTFFASPWHVIQLLLLVFNCSIVLLQIFTSAQDDKLLDRPEAGVFDYINPLLRPLFLVAISRSVRRSARSFIRVLPHIADLIYMMILLLLSFALLGAILFGFGSGKEMEEQFGSVAHSLQTMFILLTTSNFPDVMLPVYQHHRSSSLFFIAFLLLGFIMLMNLILAAFVRQYESQMRTAERLARARRDCAFEAAFMLLDLNCNGFVDLAEFSALLQRVSRPVFSLFDGETCRALDTAQTMGSLQRMLEGDAALPVRGLGPAAFAECLLALRSEEAAHTGDPQYDSDEEEDPLDMDGASPPPPRYQLDHGAVANPATESSGAGAGSYIAPAPLPSPQCGASIGDVAAAHSGHTELATAEPEPRRIVVVEDEDGRRATIGISASRTQLAPVTPAARLARSLRRVFRSRRFGQAIDALVLLNVAVVLAEVELLARKQHPALRGVEITAPLFDAAFLIEVAAKLWAFGSFRFFRRRADTYALIAGLVILLADLVTLSFGLGGGTDAPGDAMAMVIPEEGESEEPPDDAGTTPFIALRVALALRLLRVPRLVVSLQQTSTIFRHLLSKMPTFMGLFGFLFVVFTLFAQLGVALFGGKIKTTSPFPKGAELYAYCNFNDYTAALVTLFELLIVNNWYVIMDATAAVTGWWARAYCILWFCVAAVCMTNLVVAQILESVSSTLDKSSSQANGRHADGDEPRPSGRGASEPSVARRHSTAMTEQMAALVQRGPAASVTRRARSSSAAQELHRASPEPTAQEDELVGVSSSEQPPALDRSSSISEAGNAAPAPAPPMALEPSPSSQEL